MKAFMDILNELCVRIYYHDYILRFDNFTILRFHNFTISRFHDFRFIQVQIYHLSFVIIQLAKRKKREMAFFMIFYILGKA